MKIRKYRLKKIFEKLKLALCAAVMLTAALSFAAFFLSSAEVETVPVSLVSNNFSSPAEEPLSVPDDPYKLQMNFLRNAVPIVKTGRNENFLNTQINRATGALYELIAPVVVNSTGTSDICLCAFSFQKYLRLSIPSRAGPFEFELTV